MSSYQNYIRLNKSEDKQSCNAHLRPTPKLICCPSFLPYTCIREQIRPCHTEGQGHSRIINLKKKLCPVPNAECQVSRSLAFWFQRKTFLKCFNHMDRVKRIWYLSPMRAAKVQASLRIRAVSPEPSLLAHRSSESRGTFRQKARSLAPLNGWACAVEICHDGMLEDTNSLDGAHIWAWQPCWSCNPNHLNKHLFPDPQRLKMWLSLVQWLQSRRFLKVNL